MYNKDVDAVGSHLLVSNIMNVLKVAKDRAKKIALGKAAVPNGLVELNKYFRLYGPINFQSHQEDGMQVAVSTNFKYGSIVTYGKDASELDRNIKDAILTSFEIPSAYLKEAGIIRVGESKDSYAIA